MSSSEGFGPMQWEIAADGAFRGAVSIADAAEAERSERDTTAAAMLGEYTDWYNQELLLPHEQTWKLALDALVRYGRQQRYVDWDGRCLRHELSTGMVALGKPEDIHGDPWVTALRLSVQESVEGGRHIDRKLYHTIAKAQDSDSPDRRAKARDMLEGAVQGFGLHAEAYLVSTNAARLPRGQKPFTLKEVEYPQTRAQRMHNFHDARSLALAWEAMQYPDLRVEAEALYDAFPQYSYGQKRLSYATQIQQPEPFASRQLPGDTLSPSLEGAMEYAQRQHEAVAVAGDMLIRLGQPLRELIPFRPR